jgi:phage terminase small subunit
MSGVKGKSGRRPLSLVQHVARGTYRRDRHGPLPSGGRATVLGNTVLQLPTTAPSPADALTTAASGAEFVARTLAEFEEWLPGDLVLLRLAGEAFDRVLELRVKIAASGVIVRVRGGQAGPNPLLRHERAAVASFAGLLKQLSLQK